MNTNVLIFATYEIVMSILFGLLTVFICAKAINLTLLRVKGGTTTAAKDNVAMSIFDGTLIICVLYLTHGSIVPSVDALRTMVLGRNELTLTIFAIALGYFLLFYVIGISVSLLVLYLGTQLYIRATLTVDEFAEIRAHNVAVAILLSAVLLGLTFFVQPATQRLMASLINYDYLERAEPFEGQGTKIVPESGELVVPERKISPK